MSTGASSSLGRYWLLPRTLPEQLPRRHATKARTGCTRKGPQQVEWGREAAASVNHTGYRRSRTREPLCYG
ncbi:hypothetical protein SacmaDRAFT_5214 [Saccharomonospora marina XMU15]|uniref:Uncharacterized protein n=1 Tax=Saccharomonospora marina XMU15 TaxID=882083 RepID=H5X543_9PSEU|nr:hypothetical protein SacmaDRAFT_5214 [Saccharomonospora marina XMU15]